MTWLRLTRLALVLLAVLLVSTGTSGHMSNGSLGGPTGIEADDSTLSVSGERQPSKVQADQTKEDNLLADVNFDAYLRYKTKPVHGGRTTTVRMNVHVSTLREKRRRLLAELRNRNHFLDASGERKPYKQDLHKRANAASNIRKRHRMSWYRRSKIFRSDLGK